MLGPKTLYSIFAAVATVGWLILFGGADSMEALFLAVIAAFAIEASATTGGHEG